MSFSLRPYRAPDFAQARFVQAPDVRLAEVELDGVAPEGYHSTSMYPEYFKIDGRWRLAEESRMDSAVILREDGRLDVVELRNLRRGDRVILGRTDGGEEGIFLHADGFAQADGGSADMFAFRSGRSRETAFSRDYDFLYQLLLHEREYGNMLFVMGPAFAFDADARSAMQWLIENGFVHGVLAGNALATHDLEAGLLRTALGQDIYTQRAMPNGHYHHIDVINRVRACGSIPAFLAQYGIRDGIMHACVEKGVPFVLAGSIRDDGPLPEVIGDVYRAQDAMRAQVRIATTVICLATQLHSIATGNMTPSFRVVDGVVRPVYLYCVDISEFVVGKLRDRGSLAVKSFVGNVQDFLVHVDRGTGG